MDKIVGIDFGTTNSVVAFLSPEGPKVILDHEGNKLTPSVVAKHRGKLLVGEEAKENIQAFVNGTGIKEIKRQIGKKERVNFSGELLYPHEIAAIILKKVKRNADVYLGEGLKKAVITVPAEFTESQRTEIMEAGKIAGFEVEKIINEPTAALLAYSYNQSVQDEKVLCYDFGGGTFDVSIAEVSSDGVSVVGVDGDRELGGADIDEALFKIFKHALESTRRCKLSALGEYKLYLQVENIKIALSTKETASLNGKFMTTDGNEVSYFKKVTREEFESHIESVINKTINIVKKVLKEKGLSPNRIDKILLVGGSSQIPLVRRKLKALFGKEPIQDTFYTDESVAIGAAIEATQKMNPNIGIGTKLLEDVSPYSLGLKVTADGSDDVFDPLIRKNYRYGQVYTEKYNTILDYQKSMLLQVYQGENPKASANEHVCDFEITGIPEREAGEERVKVSFVYDENGVIQISATILSTGRVINRAFTYNQNNNRQQTIGSKRSVDQHFTTDEEFIDGLSFNESLKKYDLILQSKQLEEALKRDNKNEIEKIKESLLD